MTNSLPYPTLDTADLAGKTVLLRAGFDVPIENGTVTDTSRIEALVPTMKHIVDNGAVLVILAHQGRPKAERDPACSQQPLVPVLTELLGKQVQFAERCVGEDTKQHVESLQPGDVLLLENVRYEAGEKSKDEAERDAFGRELSALADVYVNDAFPNCHRNHASMTSVPKYLPGYMGVRLQKELEHLTAASLEPRQPVTLIVSGAKMETKVPVIQHFLDKGDDILIGGLIANTFMAAAGHPMGASRYQEEWVDDAKGILEASRDETNATIHVPTDAVVATGPQEMPRNVEVADVEDNECIFDVGEATAIAFADRIAASGTVLWNGPLGMYETEAFAGSSRTVANALMSATRQGTMSVIGGGDTIDFHTRYGLPLDEYTWVSMGGGAMLEFLSGQELPALAALKA